MDFFLVGGAVRDQLLNLTINDRDWVVVNGSANEMIALGFIPIGKSFPVFLHPKTKEEYALARTEKKVGPGYKGFQVNSSKNITLEQDLKRRDLTINSMALDNEKKLIDPYGGLADIRNKLIRHTSTSFNEDPLRVLRTARFAAQFHLLGFTVAVETKMLLKEISASGELDSISSDRVWLETWKAMKSSSPEVFIKLISEISALAIIFPTLNKLDDIYIKKLKKICRTTLNPHIRFALLSLLVEEIKPKSFQIFSKNTTIPKTIQKLTNSLIKYNPLMQNTISPTPTDILFLLEKFNGFRDVTFFNTILTSYEIYYQNTLHLPKLLRVTQSAISKLKSTFLQKDSLTNYQKKQLVFNSRVTVITRILNKKTS